MAMNSTVLKTDIYARFIVKAKARNPALKVLLESSGPDKVDLEWLFQSLAEATAEAVILHIQTVASVNVVVASVAGVTTGPGVSGPGTGVGTIS